MAKNPTPTNDPAALAFSAVEDALKESVFSLDSTPQQAPEKKPEPVRSERLRAADKIAQQAGAVANDDPEGRCPMTAPPRCPCSRFLIPFP